MDEAFGSVEVGDLEGTIEIAARMGGAPAIHEFGLKVSAYCLFCFALLVHSKLEVRSFLLHSMPAHRKYLLSFAEPIHGIC